VQIPAAKRNVAWEQVILGKRSPGGREEPSRPRVVVGGYHDQVIAGSLSAAGSPGDRQAGLVTAAPRAGNWPWGWPAAGGEEGGHPGRPARGRPHWAQLGAAS